MSDTKPTNPKDAIGSDKIPIHLWPEAATVLGALGLLDGALKYGRSNWRVAGIRTSIYYDALRRHAAALFEGEDIDPDSGLPHEAHILATVAIVIDARAAGKLNDDRMVAGGYRKLIDEYTPHVARLKTKHAGRNPKHYTIADSAEALEEAADALGDRSIWNDAGNCRVCKGAGREYHGAGLGRVSFACELCGGYGTKRAHEEASTSTLGPEEPANVSAVWHADGLCVACSGSGDQAHGLGCLRCSGHGNRTAYEAARAVE